MSLNITRETIYIVRQNKKEGGDPLMIASQCNGGQVKCRPGLTGPFMTSLTLVYLFGIDIHWEIIALCDHL